VRASERESKKTRETGKLKKRNGEREPEGGRDGLRKREKD